MKQSVFFLTLTTLLTTFSVVNLKTLFLLRFRNCIVFIDKVLISKTLKLDWNSKFYTIFDSKISR